MGISKKVDASEQKREDPEKDGLASASGPMTRKRKRDATATPSKAKKPVVDLMAEEETEMAQPSPKKKKASPQKAKVEEKRLKRFRDHAPGSYLEKLHRATTQRWVMARLQYIIAHPDFRMFVIDRARGGTENNPEETIEMAGTTGNIYSITINQIPSCTCPDNRRGNQCKHIVYVGHPQVNFNSTFI